MTNQQGAPEALRPIQRFNNIVGLMNPDARGLYVRYEDHVAALVEAQQPDPSAAAASKAVLAAIRAANMQLVRTGDDEFMLVTYKNAKAQCDGGKCGIGGYCDDCPTPQAESQPEPVREHDLQDVRCECCGYMTYHLEHMGCIRAARAPAQSVQEDAARLDWLALAGPTSICLVIDRPHDSEVEVSTDDVTGYGKTLREALDAARKQGCAT